MERDGIVRVIGMLVLAMLCGPAYPQTTPCEPCQREWEALPARIATTRTACASCREASTQSKAAAFSEALRSHVTRSA
jgi:hypothetical protein